MVDVVAPWTAMVARRNVRKDAPQIFPSALVPIFLLNGVSRARPHAPAAGTTGKHRATRGARC